MEPIQEYVSLIISLAKVITDKLIQNNNNINESIIDEGKGL
jgi:hypothetical protein